MHVDERDLRDQLDRLATLVLDSDAVVEPAPELRGPRRSLIPQHWRYSAAVAAALLAAVAVLGVLRAADDERQTTTDQLTPTTEQPTTTTEPVVTVPGTAIAGYDLVVDDEGRLRGYMMPSKLSLPAVDREVQAFEVRTHPETGTLNGYMLPGPGFVELSIALDPEALQQALDHHDANVNETIAGMDECEREQLEAMQQPPTPTGRPEIDCGE